GGAGGGGARAVLQRGGGGAEGANGVGWGAGAGGADRWASAVEWDVYEIEIERQPEQLAHQVWRRAGARRSVVVAAGIGLEEIDELPDRARRKRRVDREHGRGAHRDRDRVEVLGGVVRHVAVERGIDDE